MTETAKNGLISIATTKVAGKIVPTNNGWFKPKKFSSALLGKHALKSNLQSLVQSGLTFAVEGLEFSISQRLMQAEEQEPTVNFFPDTEICLMG